MFFIHVFNVFIKVKKHVLMFFYLQINVLTSMGPTALMLMIGL